MSETATTVEPPTTGQKVAAEVIGTFVLVFFGCGAAIMSGLTSGDSSGYVVTGLTFGLTVLVMAYAFGRISGGHFNPAVTLGAAFGGRLPWRQVGLYVGAQIAGGILAAFFLFAVLHGFDGFDAEGNMAQNSFGDKGTGHAWWAAFLLEFLLTAVFIWVILAVTDERNEHQVMAPLAIGLALTMIHFASMSATGTSVNPARSIGPALFAGADYILMLWLFILAPLLGAAVAGITYPLIFGGADPVPGSGLNFSKPATAPAQYGVPGQYPQYGMAGQQAPEGYPPAGDYGQYQPGQYLAQAQPQPEQWSTPAPSAPDQWSAAPAPQAPQAPSQGGDTAQWAPPPAIGEPGDPAGGQTQVRPPQPPPPSS